MNKGIQAPGYATPKGNQQICLQVLCHLKGSCWQSKLGEHQIHKLVQSMKVTPFDATKNGR